MYFVDRSVAVIKPKAPFLAWLNAGALSLAECESADFDRIMQLIRKYADLPMDFADASLVALCERLGIRHVATFDGDFAIYRFRDRFSFHNVVSLTAQD